MPNKQKFQEGVGDAFYARRGHLTPKEGDDWVLKGLYALNVNPKSVIEIGCGDGWRLGFIKKRFPDCRCVGIDPSPLALRNRADGFDCMVGTADTIPYTSGQFDVVIYGHCLCYTDRADYFKIAYEGDRILKTGGYLVVHDFYPSFPQYNVNPDDNTMMTYKMNFASMWSWHPAYEQRFKHVYVEDGAACEPLSVQIFLKKEIL